MPHPNPDQNCGESVLVAPQQGLNVTESRCEWLANGQIKQMIGLIKSLN